MHVPSWFTREMNPSLWMKHEEVLVDFERACVEGTFDVFADDFFDLFFIFHLAD
jgi:hypothetical protein